MKHTPGPWTSVIRSDGIEDTPAVTANPFETIAETRRDLYSFDECEANARLIAAAPELLAILEEYAEYNGDYAASMPDEAWVERVRVVVRKAKGE